MLSRNAFTDFKKRLDHTEYGGAPSGSQRRLLHHARVFEYQRDQERNSRRGGVPDRRINREIEKGLASIRPVAAGQSV